MGFWNAILLVFFADPVKLVLMAKAKKTSSVLAVTKLLVLEVLRADGPLARRLGEGRIHEVFVCASSRLIPEMQQPSHQSQDRTETGLHRRDLCRAVSGLLSFGRLFLAVSSSTSFSPYLIGHPSRTVAFSKVLHAIN